MKNKQVKCKWQIDDEGIYETGCGNRFEFWEGTPKENRFIYCPYCGKPLIEKVGK